MCAEAQKMLALDLSAMDGLRGITSLVIVIGHFFTFWAPNYVRDPSVKDPYPSLGVEYLSAVTLFLALSGFTLTVVYDKEQEQTGQAQGDNAGDMGTQIPLSTPEQRSAFLWRRIYRLAPLYYLGLALSLPELLLFRPLGTLIPTIPLSLVGLQAWYAPACNWNGPLWTVSALLIFYRLFPSLLTSLRARSSGILVLIGVTCMLLSYAVCAVWMLLLGPGNAFPLHSFPVIRLPHFIMGMIAALLARRAPVPKPTLVSEACTVILALDAVGCGVVASMAGFNGWMLWMYSAEFLLAPLLCLWMAALCTPGCTGPTRHFLLTRPARAMGSISYALYCLHWPVLIWASIVMVGWGNVVLVDGAFFWNFPPYAIVPLLATACCVASLAHWLLEVQWKSQAQARGPRTLQGEASNKHGQRLLQEENDGLAILLQQPEAVERPGGSSLA